MDRMKCYQNVIGETFDECVNRVMQQVRAYKKKTASVVLLFDGVPLTITKASTYKSIKYDYMIKWSKL